MTSLADIYACHAAIPAQVGAIPSLLTPFDRCAYAYAVRHLYSGAGLIIDAGTFLGGTTAILGSGLAARPGGAKSGHERIVALDTFVFPSERLIRQYRRHRVRAGLGEGAARIAPGDSFRPEFEANVAPYADLIEIVEGDILRHSHDGRPVDLLCLDLCKAPEVAAHCARIFFPALVPGVSHVLHQDHVHPNLPFNQILFELFADKFERQQEDISTTIFRCIAPVTAAEAEDRLGTAGTAFYHGGQEALMLQAAEKALTPRSSLVLKLALAMFHRRFGRAEQAESVFVAALIEHRDVLAALNGDELAMLRNYHKRQMSL